MSNPNQNHEYNLNFNPIQSNDIRPEMQGYGYHQPHQDHNGHYHVHHHHHIHHYHYPYTPHQGHPGHHH